MVALGLLAAALHACSIDLVIGGPAEEEGHGGSSSVVGGAPTTSVGVTSVGGGGSGEGGSLAEGGAPPSCGPTWQAPAPVVPPLDIVLVVDNSGSMHEEIAAIEQNINVNFAQVLIASDIDYQVVVVSNHGTGPYDLCVTPPLSNATSCAVEPGDVEGRFHHYDVDVQSFDALCRLLETYRGTVPDQWNLHPEGWSSWLRPEAKKAFMVFSDDRVNCTNGAEIWDDLGDTQPSASFSAAAAVATAFDHALASVDIVQFGTVSDRRYRFYSVIGVQEKPSPHQDAAHEPWETIVAEKCPTSPSPGPGYQWLSKGTDAGRYSICSPQSHDALFLELAADIIADATLPCELELISSDVDSSQLLINYSPGDGSSPETWNQVSSADSCLSADDAFYIEGDRLRFCPATCERVEPDGAASFEVTCASP